MNMALKLKLQALSSIALGLCQDVSISIEVDPDQWRWDPVRRVLKISQKDLEEKSIEYCATLIVREIGHLHICRSYLFKVDFPSMIALQYLLDRADSMRCVNWMVQRYPGVEDWVNAAMAELQPVLPMMPPFLQFAESLSDMNRAHPFLSESVVEALHEVVDSYIEYIEIYPNRNQYIVGADPAEIDPNLEIEPSDFLRSSYEFKVKPSLYLFQQMPSPREQLVQLFAAEAFYLFEVEILPTALKLYEESIDDLSALLNHQKNASTARQALQDGDDIESLIREMKKDAYDQPNPPQKSSLLRDLSISLFDRMLEQKYPKKLMSKSDLVDGLEDVDEPVDPHQELAQPNQPVELLISEYDQQYEKISYQVDLLIRKFEELLTPKQKIRQKSGYPTGNQIDLKRLMHFDADPRTYHLIWSRKNIPHRRNLAVLLLVDLSGSMRGEKVDSAILGTILLAETLSKMKINFAVFGFQDQLIPLIAFQQGMDDVGKSNLLEMENEVHGNRPFGNNEPSYNDDGPCLAQAAELLLQQAASERYLLVVSDGLPEGRSSSKDDLRNAIEAIQKEQLINLMALGLGPRTEHVLDYYAPMAIANVPIEAFSWEISRLLERMILGRGDEGE
jgi:hypothetical protein